MPSLKIDLHVHVGSTRSGRLVKVTASRRLTINGVLQAAQEKGLDLVGIVDFLNPELQEEVSRNLDLGVWSQIPGGGIQVSGGPAIIPAVEMEGAEGAHLLAFFPDLQALQGFSRDLNPREGHFRRSCPRVTHSLAFLGGRAWARGGFLVPAHAFTPHKGLWGRRERAAPLLEGLDPEAVPALELGLSADTGLATRVPETAALAFLSASDAHSPEKLAREYTVIECREVNFQELQLAMAGKRGRGIRENVGLAPELGKYHRSHCHFCQKTWDMVEPPLLQCPVCGPGKLTVGVLDRILHLERVQGDYHGGPVGKRPPYRHQVPLELIPGIGPGKIRILREQFGSEMAVLRTAREDELSRLVGATLARRIIMGRFGELPIIPGGGGHYGRVLAETSSFCGCSRSQDGPGFVRNSKSKPPL